MIKVTLRDDVKEFESGITVAEIAKSIGMGLYKAALGGRINGEYCCQPLPESFCLLQFSFRIPLQFCFFRLQRIHH